MEAITTQYHRESADNALVDALLASVLSSSSEVAAADRIPSRRQPHEQGSNDERDERAEGEEVGSAPAPSDPERDEGNEGNGENEEGELMSRTRRRRGSPTTKKK